MCGESQHHPGLPRQTRSWWLYGRRSACAMPCPSHRAWEHAMGGLLSLSCSTHPPPKAAPKTPLLTIRSPLHPDTEGQCREVLCKGILRGSANGTMPMGNPAAQLVQPSVSKFHGCTPVSSFSKGMNLDKRTRADSVHRCAQQL